MKRDLPLYFLLFFLTEYCYAQTYIKPIIGRDFTRLEEKIEPEVINGLILDFHIREKGFNFESTLFGVKLETQLSPKCSMGLISTYTKKKFGATISLGVAYREGFTFNYFRNQIGLNYKLNEYLFWGLGGNFNIITNFKDNKSNYQLISVLKDFGVHGTIGATFQNIQLEIYYLHNLTSHEDKKSGINLAPIQSLGATLGYKIRL